MAERLLDPLLEEAKWPYLATVAALVALRSGDSARLGQVFEAVRSTQGEQQQALALALALADDPRIDRAVTRELETAPGPELRARWLDLATKRRLDPGPQLHSYLRAEHGPLVVAALTAAGRAGRRDLTSYVEYHLEAEDSERHEAAIEAGLALGSQRAWGACLDEARGTDRPHLRALVLVALLGGRREHQRILEKTEDPRTREAALWDLGFTGSVEAADRCRPFLFSDDERVVKLAAEALAAIAGFNLFSSELKAAPETADKKEELPPLAGDDLEADLVPDGVDELPLPNAPVLEARWQEQRRKLSEGGRYLEGQVFSPETLVEALQRGPMRRRHTWALELTLRTGGARQVAAWALAPRQRWELQALAGLHEGEMINHYGGVW